MKKKYRVSGLFNGGSALFGVNPRGWIGKAICIELEEDELTSIEEIYLEKVRDMISFMAVTMVMDVKVEDECSCSENEDGCSLK
jgi:hypothetical protein